VVWNYFYHLEQSLDNSLDVQKEEDENSSLPISLEDGDEGDTETKRMSGFLRRFVPKGKAYSGSESNSGYDTFSRRRSYTTRSDPKDDSSKPDKMREKGERKEKKRSDTIRGKHMLPQLDIESAQLSSSKEERKDKKSARNLRKSANLSRTHILSMTTQMPANFPPPPPPIMKLCCLCGDVRETSTCDLCGKVVCQFCRGSENWRIEMCLDTNTNHYIPTK
jgi:hypothetical protein